MAVSWQIERGLTVLVSALALSGPAYAQDCKSDSDCPKGLACDVSDVCGFSKCTRDADCPSDMLCNTTTLRCRPRYQAPCEQGSDCGEGFDCVARYCVTRTIACTSAAECPANWTCGQTIISHDVCTPSGAFDDAGSLVLHCMDAAIGGAPQCQPPYSDISKNTTNGSSGAGSASPASMKSRSTCSVTRVRASVFSMTEGALLFGVAVALATRRRIRR